MTRHRRRKRKNRPQPTAPVPIAHRASARDQAGATAGPRAPQGPPAGGGEPTAISTASTAATAAGLKPGERDQPGAVQRGQGAGRFFEPAPAQAAEAAVLPPRGPEW